MKRAANLFLVVLFAVTLWLLGSHIFSGTRSLAPAGREGLKEYKIVAELALGQVEVLNFQRMGFTKGFLRFSPDGRHLAVGTENGDVLLLTAEGKLLWRKNMGLGKIVCLEFNHDGSGVLVGENSQQGGLFLFSVRDGREIWKQSSAGELGVNIKDKTYPGIVAVRTDGSGNVYAIGTRYIRHSDGRNEYQSRLYKFSPGGERLAVFPPERNMDAWVNWFSVDQAGETLVFGTANWDESRKWDFGDTLYCMDGGLRQVRWSKLLPPIPPYTNTTMRNGPEISPDGRRVAGSVSDGRAFLYDARTGTELWMRTLSEPRKIAGVYLNATGMYVRIAGEYAIFSTGNTYNRANWQLPTPVEHPASNSVFVFDSKGAFVSRHSEGGMIEDIGVGETRLALAVGRNVRAKDLAVHGLSILSLPDAAPVDRLSTTGPVVAAAITADGRYAAAIEAPIQLDDGQVAGQYRLIMIKQKASGE